MQKITNDEIKNIIDLIGENKYNENKIIKFYGSQLDQLKKNNSYDLWLECISNGFFCSIIIKNNLVKEEKNKNTNDIIGTLFEANIYQEIEKSIYRDNINFNILFKKIKENICERYLALE